MPSSRRRHVCCLSAIRRNFRRFARRRVRAVAIDALLPVSPSDGVSPIFRRGCAKAGIVHDRAQHLSVDAARKKLAE